MTSITDESGDIAVVAGEDISRPPYFGTPENPQTFIQQYVGEFVVGGFMQYAGWAGYGWGNYWMQYYGSILMFQSLNYIIGRYIIDHWLNFRIMIWFNNISGFLISYVQQGAAGAGAIGLLATMTNLSGFDSSGKTANFMADLVAIGYGAFMIVKAAENTKSR